MTRSETDFIPLRESSGRNAAEADEKWFCGYPKRHHRVRPERDGEFLHPSVSRSKGARWVVVRQLATGVRLTVSCTLPLDGQKREFSEGEAKQLFDYCWVLQQAGLMGPEAGHA